MRGTDWVGPERTTLDKAGLGRHMVTDDRAEDPDKTA